MQYELVIEKEVIGKRVKEKIERMGERELKEILEEINEIIGK